MKAKNPKTIQDQIDQAACGTSRKLYRINGAEFLLQVTPKGVKSWCYRYTLNNKTRVIDRKSTRLNSSHLKLSRMPSSA